MDHSCIRPETNCWPCAPIVQYELKFRLKSQRPDIWEIINIILDRAIYFLWQLLLFLPRSYNFFVLYPQVCIYQLTSQGYVILHLQVLLLSRPLVKLGTDALVWGYVTKPLPFQN